MQKKTKQLVLAVTLSVIGSAGLFIGGAQAADNNNLDKYSTDEYVVTATRTALTQKEVPQSVEVVTKEEIQNTGAVNVKDALRIATNIEYPDAAGTGNELRIRGGGKNDVLILINGHRVATENITATVSTNTYALERLNVNNIERIEILRGAAGALYGSDAQSGVINIITKKPEKQSMSIGVNTGSREINNYYHFDSGKQGKVSAVFDANFTKVRYLKYNGALMSRYYGPKQNYTLNLDYDMDENNKLNFFAEYDKENMRYDMMGSERAYIMNRKSAILTYDGKSGASNYSVSASYSQLDKESSESKYKIFNLEARDTVKLDKNNRLTFGGEFRSDEAPVNDKDKTTEQYALYIHDEFKIGDKVLIIPSVRYDHHDSFGSNTSPNIGVTYEFNNQSRFKVNYGEGYRAPSIYELYNEGSGMMWLEGNPNLKPEKSKGYELSYEQEWKDTSAKLTYFKTNKKDAIETQIIDPSFGFFGKQKYFNVDETSSEGIEFEIQRELGNGFTLIGNYDWLDAIDKSDNTRLNYNARNTYTLKLMWTEPLKQEWNVIAWNKWYTDYRADDDNDYSVNTFNIVVNKRWGDRYRAYVGLDNLFDKEVDAMRYTGRLWRAGFEMTF